MDDRAMNQPMTWPHIGYTYLPRVRGVISMALNVNTPYRNEHFRFSQLFWKSHLCRSYLPQQLTLFSSQKIKYRLPPCRPFPTNHFPLPSSLQLWWTNEARWFPRGRPSILYLLPIDQLAIVCLRSSAYQADERREEHPAEFPPAARPVADHVLDVLVKPLRSCGHTSVTGKIVWPANKSVWGESCSTGALSQGRRTDIISCRMLDIIIPLARVSWHARRFILGQIRKKNCAIILES